MISLYGLFADSVTISQHLSSLKGSCPKEDCRSFAINSQKLTSQPLQKLGLATATSLAISLWSADGGVKAMFEGLSAVYEKHEKRSFIKLNLISLAFTFGLLVFVIASLLTITIVPKLISYVGLAGLSIIVSYARWPSSQL